MRDRGRIVAGIVLFVAAVLFPVWCSAARGGAPRAPELDPGAGSGPCVEDTEWMRASHMDLLDRWRDDVVRGEGEPYHVVRATGERVEKSLTRTCLGCHTNRAGFCDRCHEYVGVDPYCFDCHDAPGGD